MIEAHCKIIKNLKLNPKTILEIGSRDGHDASYYRKFFNIKNEDVYIVEPNPKMFNILKNTYSYFNLFELAISDKSGPQEFYQVDDDENVSAVGISSLKDRNLDDFYQRFKTNKIIVNAITGKQLLSTINKEIDICKVDVEGMTYEVLLSMGELIKKIKTIHVESETLQYWKNEKLEPEIFDFLEKNNFVLVFYNNIGGQTDSVWIDKELYLENLKNVFGDLEIHTLICKKDVLMGINNVKSFQKFYEFKNVPIIFHDDGSLSSSDKELLLSLPNTQIIDKTYADNLIINFIDNFNFSKTYRLVNHPIHLWHKIKLFDYLYFSKTKKILGMDSDLLFMKRPLDVITNILQNIPFYFPDIQSAYCFQEPKNEIPVLENVNTGLIFIPSEEYYNIHSIEKALSNLIRNNINYFPSWIEQSAFAHMFLKDGRYVSLNKETHRIPYFQPINNKIAECLHFVSYPATRELYEMYLNFLDLEKYDEIYKKEFKIEFKQHTIPLDLSIKKNNDFYLFNFYWGLEKTSQNMLDHAFEIDDTLNKEQFKFQSDKNGIFLYKTTSNKITINHTYNWYGEINWITLDVVNL